MRHVLAVATLSLSLLVAVAAVAGSSDVVTAGNTSNAPYGSHLLDKPTERAFQTTPYADSIRAIRGLADDLEAGRSVSVAAWEVLVNLRERAASQIDRDSRVVIQNAALRIANVLERDSAGAQFAFSNATRALIKRVALPQATLQLMARLPLFGAEDWLGAESSWVERTTRFCGDGPLFHEQEFNGLLAFHPVRSGDKRALISQLVAIDDRGNPHITPIVEAIEMRLGMKVDSPVAILELDIDSLGSEYAGLQAPAINRIHVSEFVQPDNNGGFRCTRCHRSPSAWGAADVADSASADALRVSRREHLLSFAREQVNELELDEAAKATWVDSLLKIAP